METSEPGATGAAKLAELTTPPALTSGVCAGKRLWDARRALIAYSDRIPYEDSAARNGPYVVERCFRCALRRTTLATPTRSKP